MCANFVSRDKQMRARIAAEAARIMVEQGVTDFYAAKRKAAVRLGSPDTRNMPRNVEVETAMSEYRRLFQSGSHPQRLRRLRKAAVEAMCFLEQFHPRLVGSVLRGTAGEFADVNLHVFAETPEDVRFFLRERNIPFEERDRRLRHFDNEMTTYPVYSFVAKNVRFDLTVFPLNGQRQAPLSPVDGKPMRRASAEVVEKLLEEEDDSLVS